MSDGPIHLYRQRLRDGTLRPDSVQLLAIEKLQSLHQALKGYRPTAGRPGLMARLGFGRRQEGPEPPQGLYLFGDVGRGKSMLMDLFFEAAPLVQKRRVHFHAFMQEIHARLHDWRQSTRHNAKATDPLPRIAEDVAAEACLLCFDEFHVQNIADAMILGRLFEALFAQGVVVVATSNVAPDDLYAGGLQRERFLPFIALIQDKLDVLALEGPTDYRMTRLKGVAVYYCPLDAAAYAAMDHAFQRLGAGEHGGPEVVTVQGREILVPRAVSGVAWFRFSDLCARPLGAADYLALARRYHTLLVSDIPIMSPDQRNEARRFMTLIDSLYEHATKLICSAAAAPHGLYPQGEGAREFLRTISRLVEMQSEVYQRLPHNAAPAEPAQAPPSGTKTLAPPTYHYDI